MQALFSEVIWLGGFYELALEYEPASDALLERALQAIWAFPDLQGCYLRPGVEPSQQQRLAPSLALLEENGHLRGIATLPQGRKVACGTYMVREEQGPAWVSLYLPMGALAKVYDAGAFPFESSGACHCWREPLDQWLAAVGEFVFSKVPFRLGLVGFEVSGTESAEDLAITGIPENRSIGLLYVTDHHLSWYPTNQWQQTPDPAS
jgi:hypothetical protein